MPHSKKQIVNARKKLLHIGEIVKNLSGGEEIVAGVESDETSVTALVYRRDVVEFLRRLWETDGYGEGVPLKIRLLSNGIGHMEE